MLVTLLMLLVTYTMMYFVCDFIVNALTIIELSIKYINNYHAK